MAAEDKDTDIADSKPKSGKLKLIIFVVLGAVLLIGASIGGTWFLLHQETSAGDGEGGEHAEGEAATAEHLGPPIYLNLAPPFTININNSSRMLRMSISVLVYGEQNELTLTSLLPKVRNSILEQLGEVKSENLSQRTGKDELREKILEATRKAVGEQMNPEEIKDVFFTDFIMQ